MNPRRRSRCRGIPYAWRWHIRVPCVPNWDASETHERSDSSGLRLVLSRSSNPQNLWHAALVQRYGDVKRVQIGAKSMPALDVVLGLIVGIDWKLGVNMNITGEQRRQVRH